MSAALINALDNFTLTQFGENGSTEYTWSNQLQEQILQLSFQLVRDKKKTQTAQLQSIADTIVKTITSYKTTQVAMYRKYMSIMIRLIAQTRDIVDGKGEYDLSFMLLQVLYKYDATLALEVFRLFLLPPTDLDTETHPYGSWKDVKQFYKFAEQNAACPFVIYGSQLLLDQLRKDIDSDKPSLAAKWVPREKSQHNQLFEELAFAYFSNYLETATSSTNASAMAKAKTKAKMDFRKVISTLNRKLDTVQIKQCADQWELIEPSKQTSITMHKQKRAFLNLDKKGKQRSEKENRVECASKFKAYAEKAVKGEVDIKGKRVGLEQFTVEALALRQSHDQSLIDILNAQWVNSSKETGNLGKMIAMVDVSGSMYGDPLHAAIALGIRIAEKSSLGKRVLTFSSKPAWVDLTHQTSFVEMVQTVYAAQWQMNTNFQAALRMILDAILQYKLSPEEVEGMTLVVLSDMQMDQADHNRSLTVMESIENEYAAVGMKLWGKPFKAPHILFWNLRATNGFPTLSTQKNASMMSGFSPALLNTFCETGIEALQEFTPWSALCKSLDAERYMVLESIANKRW